MQGNPPPFLLLATAVAQIAPKSGAKTGLRCLTLPLLETAHTALHSGPHRWVFRSLVYDRQGKFFLAVIFVYSDPSGEVPDDSATAFLLRVRNNSSHSEKLFCMLFKVLAL